MSFSSLLDSTINVQANTKTTDSQGGHTASWATVFSSLPARIQPMSGTEQSIYGAEKTVSTHKIFTETGSTITTGHRIVFGTRRYDIQLVRNIDEMDHHYEIECREVIT